MNSLLFLTLNIFYLSLFSIIINRLHFLSVLLCLELLLISLFLIIIFLSFILSNNFILINNLILLTLSACEASIGLSLMVALSRTHSSDLLNNINILQQ
uniref:NADH dehydrogenase subunit 4L n=1 Tax=Asthenactis papyraceus TaxID=2939277 RepID=UPI002027BFA3|nr:NADH dehydrogenase subunit 4L [Asthenactis papyraceus]UPP55880.1 NADH dehydrogenase subunit 4L [Asthenactis papyraceus]